MAKKISVSIECDIDCIATEEEEKVIKKLEDLDYTSEEYDELYTELTDKLETLLSDRISKELEKLNGTGRILDINWE
jgi:hypothetical protein